MTCYNPSDNSLVTSDVHIALKDDVDDAVNAARLAFPGWASTPPLAKSKVLLKAADLIEEHAQTFARLESICSGKPLQATVMYEAGMAANVFRCMWIHYITEPILMRQVGVTNSRSSTGS